MSQTDIHYITVLLEHAERVGLSPDRLLNRVGLDRQTLEQKRTIDTSYSSELIRRLWEETNDEQLGLCATPMKRGVFYIAAKLALHSSCLHEGLKEAFHLYSIVTNSIHSMIEVVDERAVITIKLDTADKDPDHFLLDFTLSSWHRFSCWLIGCQIPLLDTYLPFSAPDNNRYAHIFPSSIHYEQSCARIEFDAKYLSYSSVRTRAELREFIRRSPADILTTEVKDLSYESQVKAILLELTHTELIFPPFEILANKLCVSSQTLRRRLKAEGTSYQNIKDILRRDHCIELLTKTNKPLAEIAQSSGFSEPATLSRSFKRWTGYSPYDYRTKYKKPRV